LYNVHIAIALAHSQVREDEPFGDNGFQREIYATSNKDVYPQTGSEQCVFESLRRKSK
jgi:hypothetical protein